MVSNIQNINAKSVLKYTLLPGILPRAREFAGSGFAFLSYLFVLIFQLVRILPDQHPFLRSENFGKFTIRQVIAAAADNIEFSRKNIDQIIIFFAILAGIVILALQFVFFLGAIFVSPAMAASGSSAPFLSIFRTEHPEYDVALTMLDMTFGIPSSSGGSGTIGFFGSNALVDGITPFHAGLHALIQFYNLAILLIGSLIFVYYIFVVVIETAQTGVPFGRRFSKIYAPLRLVVAIGLLVPLNYGFNAAQYITFYVAKIGSSMATNGWILYNSGLDDPTGMLKATTGGAGDENAPSLVARPKTPAINGIFHFASIYHACREIYGTWVPMSYGLLGTSMHDIKPYVIIEGNASELFSLDYSAVREHFPATDAQIVLGQKMGEGSSEYSQYPGGVIPYCGKITLSFSNRNPQVFSSGATEDSAGATGVEAVQKGYFDLVKSLLQAGNENKFSVFGARVARFHNDALPHADSACYGSDVLGDADTCGKPSPFPGFSVFDGTISDYTTTLESDVEKAYLAYRQGIDFKLTQELERRGWGGAGIWYNNISDVNGALAAAIYAVPSVSQYPSVMETTRAERQKQNQQTAACKYFDPNLADNRTVDYGSTLGLNIAKALNEVFQYWECDVPDQTDEGATKGDSNNVIVTTMDAFFGVGGLFELRKNSEVDSATGLPRVHPVAQLSSMGKSMIETSIRNMAIGIGVSFAGGIAKALGYGGGIQAFAGMFISMATISLTIGFLLYYVLPFLPFLYFFFAVGGWVKSIFEAVVGVPLWALAHLKIDGPGLPGPAAASGYFLLFEIMLRPIAILFGLVAAMTIFSAMVIGLNSLFDLAVYNVSGVNDTGVTGGALESVDDLLQDFRRGTIDQFFFTIVYAILVYMMALSSFKLITSIPAMFMRWLGSGVSAFNDDKVDPLGGLNQYAVVGAAGVSNKLFSSAGGIASKVGEGTSSGAKGLAGKFKKGGSKSASGEDVPE